MYSGGKGSRVASDMGIKLHFAGGGERIFLLFSTYKRIRTFTILYMSHYPLQIDIIQIIL